MLRHIDWPTIDKHKGRASSGSVGEVGGVKISKLCDQPVFAQLVLRLERGGSHVCKKIIVL